MPKERKDTVYLIANLFVGSLLLALGIVNIIAGLSSFKAFVVGVYGCIFGSTIILAEFGMRLVIFKYCGFLSNLIGRGLFYIFAGILLFQPAYSGIGLLLFILGIIVMVIGGLYLILWCIPSMRPNNDRI
jgi:hypothetical protein